MPKKTFTKKEAEEKKPKAPTPPDTSVPEKIPSTVHNNDELIIETIPTVYGDDDEETAEPKAAFETVPVDADQPEDSSEEPNEVVEESQEEPEEAKPESSENDEEAPLTDEPKFVTKKGGVPVSSPLSQALSETPTVKAQAIPELPDLELTDDDPAEPEANESQPEAKPAKEIKSSPNPEAAEPKPESKEVSRPVAKPAPESSSNSLFTTGLIIFLLIFGITGWALYFKDNMPGSISLPGIQSQPSPTPNASPTPETSPSPTATPRSEIKVEVLNGSGVSGMAAKVQAELERLGYTVANIGNAPRSNYQKTEVYTNPNFATAELLLSDLSGEFGPASVSGELKDSSLSAQIIIGKDWAN